MKWLVGLAAGLIGGECAVERSDILNNVGADYEVVELFGVDAVREFSSAVGVNDVVADEILIVDWPDAGVSKGYWFSDGCLVDVRVLDVGMGIE